MRIPPEVDLMDGQDVAALLPEVAQISDPGLREGVVKAWRMALDRSAFEDLRAIPFTLLIEDLEDSLLEHTRRVTKAADAVAATRSEVNRDMVLAGALLHDVGKVLEYEPGPGGKVRQSEMGKRIRHPVSGAALAQEAGLPLAVVHIVAAHAGEGNMVSRTPEAIVIHHVDMIDFEITKAVLGRGGEAPKPK